MFKALTLVSLLQLAIPALTIPCVTFDSSFNLLALGLGGKDWNAGTQDKWTSGEFLYVAIAIIAVLNSSLLHIKVKLPILPQQVARECHQHCPCVRY